MATPGPEHPGPEHPDRDLLTLARLARVLERGCGDLTLAQYRILALVADGEERASDLAGRLALARPTVSATVDTLVERGLVDRAVVADDRRSLRLSATSAGRRVLRDSERSMRERLDTLLAHVDDVAVVEQALARLGDALDARRSERIRARTLPR